jgi:hypothetical protein
MVKLTNATEEFVILLHVSSFSPSSTPRPYSPMMNGNGHGPPSQPQPPSFNFTQGIYLNSPLQEEAKPSVSLSRSKSATPAGSLGSLHLVVPQDGPKSAMVSSGFDVPYYPRLRPTLQRDMSVDSQG